jgi:hypothetical protein
MSATAQGKLSSLPVSELRRRRPDARSSASGTIPIGEAERLRLSAASVVAPKLEGGTGEDDCGHNPGIGCVADDASDVNAFGTFEGVGMVGLETGFTGVFCGVFVMLLVASRKPERIPPAMRLPRETGAECEHNWCHC